MVTRVMGKQQVGGQRAIFCRGSISHTFRAEDWVASMFYEIRASAFSMWSVLQDFLVKTTFLFQEHMVTRASVPQKHNTFLLQGIAKNMQ